MDKPDDLASRLIASFRETLNGQVLKVLARRIHARVRDARSDPDRAARRWPFELLQNAHDAGPREDQDGISVSFALDGGVLRFEHDAAPFSMSDIAALLTGGSNKDFDSTETTGRFGTGFLVTHALSERIKVAGVLEVEAERRAFEIALDRPDDEDAILRNLMDSQNALGQTCDVPAVGQQPTATIEYVVDDRDTALAGLQALEGALPFLFGSCRRLHEVRIRRDQVTSRWIVTGPTENSDYEGIRVNRVSVRSKDASGVPCEWRVIRGAVNEEARGRLLVALRQRGDRWVVWPPEDVPRVFRQLPLMGAPALSTSVIIDGEFDVDQERSSLHVIGDQGDPLRQAFESLGGLALLAVHEEWVDGWRVAQLGTPSESLGDKAALVWREALSSAAARLACLPLVKTYRRGRLPAAKADGQVAWADLLPRASSGPSHAELWELAAECTTACPPVRDESEGWSEVGEGWATLGVAIPWLDLEHIGKFASRDAKDVATLAVEGDHIAWLARYFEAVGKQWRATGITKATVSRLLPDQAGTLRSFGELRRDSGVSETVKTIGASVGLDIRGRVLDSALIQALRGNGLDAGLQAVTDATGEELTEDEAVDSIVEHMCEALPADQVISAQSEGAGAATLALLTFLWESRRENARKVACNVPLLAADGTSRRAAQRRLMVPPVMAWPEAARPFAKAYPAGRILDDRYATAPEREVLLEALATWGVTHRGLLELTQREELRDRGLRAIATAPSVQEGAVLRDAKLTQIALLEPELLNHCKQSREQAQALLGLVVRYVAGEDESWRSTVDVSVRTPEGEHAISVTPTLWLSDLKSKPWIPVEDSEGVTHHVPSPALLRELIDSSWLEDNAAGTDLLVRHFDMDALEVRLLGAARDEETRKRLRDSLARIVEAAGNNPQLMDDLLAKVEERRRDVDRMRRMGLAVQDAVRAAMEKLGLTVQLVDRGYDYLVTAVNVRDDDSEELSAYFEIGERMIEVKATTTGEVRLTPLQAATSASNPERFVLCVVDLRNFKGDVHKVDWEHEDVSELCRLTPGGRLPIDATLSLVRDAEAGAVPIRNATALRYAVSPELWMAGIPLDEWVGATFA